MCDEYGIIFIETEESYTCRGEWPFAPTFLDGDNLPNYGEKLGAGARTQVPSKEAPTLRANDWKPSGKRIKRCSAAKGGFPHERLHQDSVVCIEVVIIG
ncbi:MAG: hypothetical protein F6K23_21490 [Okeania sp. SIO2C9]|uniref:hypothetical protein n=1 Tax=Okeania sp. SIO2C9 TaxID=2607791 RepID=UPI0013C0867D|nr:hypothetical protein [Okeania sp. SIO2C9]NEQ75395.1 hypothetical protein [Okeania sp. SIO2C9]